MSCFSSITANSLHSNPSLVRESDAIYKGFEKKILAITG
jgi:hypothetical protein